MAKKNSVDGVIETVRYSDNGEIAWVRAYERRGPTFSDIRILNRTELLAKIHAGLAFYTGSRVPLNASTFNTEKRVRVEKRNGREVLLTENSSSATDRLEGVPIV